jgi:hypothetical protein
VIGYPSTSTTISGATVTTVTTGGSTANTTNSGVVVRPGTLVQTGADNSMSLLGLLTALVAIVVSAVVYARKRA